MEELVLAQIDKQQGGDELRWAELFSVEALDEMGLTKEQIVEAVKALERDGLIKAKVAADWYMCQARRLFQGD